MISDRKREFIKIGFLIVKGTVSTATGAFFAYNKKDLLPLRQQCLIEFLRIFKEQIVLNVPAINSQRHQVLAKPATISNLTFDQVNGGKAQAVDSFAEKDSS